MITLCNAFSLNMLDCDFCDINIQKVSVDYVNNFINFIKNDYVQNAIGHKETDVLVRNMLNNENIPVGERMNVTLEELNYLVVAQYKGPRLPEGATQLPEGARIEFFVIEMIRGY